MALGIMPTGSGKTRTYAFIIEAAVQAGLKVALFAPKIELTRQNVQSVLGATGDNLIEETFAEIHSGTGGVQKNSPQALAADIHSITYANLNSDNAVSFEDYDIVIFDEAHYLLQAALWKKAQSLKQPNNKVLAIAATATPKKSEASDLAKLFGDAFYTLTLKEAIERGILAGAEAYLVNVDVNLELGTTQADGSYKKEQLAKINNIAMNKVALELFMREAREKFLEAKAPPVIKVFATSVQHCQDIVKMCNDFFEEHNLNFKADYLAGKRKDKENRKVIADAKAGKVNIVVSDQIAIEGLDIPRISAVVNLDPASVIPATQRLGRGLRQYDEATIMSVAGLKQGLLNGSLKWALDLYEKFAESQIVKIYDVISADMQIGTLASDILEGAVCYPIGTPPKSRKSTKSKQEEGEEEDLPIEGLPEFKIISNIEKTAEIRAEREQKKTSSPNSLNKAEVNPENVKAWMIAHAERKGNDGKYPNWRTQGDALDENGNNTGNSWYAVEKILRLKYSTFLKRLRDEILKDEGIIPASERPEIDPENVKEWLKYNKTPNGKYPNLNTKGKVLYEKDGKREDTGIASWNAIDSFLKRTYKTTLAKLTDDILEENGHLATPENVKEWMKAHAKRNNGKYPNQDTKGKVLNEHGSDTGIISWRALNARLVRSHNKSLSDLAKELRKEKKEEQNNVGPDTATISPEPKEEELLPKTIIHKIISRGK